MIVGVTNEDRELARDKMEQAKMAYPVAITPGNTAEEAYDITGVPRAFLIDRRGRLVWSGHPAQLDEALLAEVIAER